MANGTKCAERFRYSLKLLTRERVSQTTVRSAAAQNMSGSLVEELQRDAINRDARVSDLLRKALLVASKLGIPGVPDWISKELSGYEARDDVPPYRKLHGRVVARSLRGWTPVQFPNSDLQSTISEQAVYQPVAEIENLLSAEEDLRCNFPPEGQQLLQELFQVQTEFTCLHSRASLARILDEVKNRILRWSIELSEAGIRGDGLAFSPQEKQAAHSIVVHGVMNAGVIGDVQSSRNIAVGDSSRAGDMDAEDVRSLITALEPHVTGARLTADQKKALSTALTELSDEATVARVDPSKTQRILRRILQISGKLADHVVGAGIKVVVEAWMKTHGLIP